MFCYSWDSDRKLDNTFMMKNLLGKLPTLEILAPIYLYSRMRKIICYNSLTYSVDFPIYFSKFSRKKSFLRELIKQLLINFYHVYTWKSPLMKIRQTRAFS